MHEWTAFAPGRVELLGNHTDYNQGFIEKYHERTGLRCDIFLCEIGDGAR